MLYTELGTIQLGNKKESHTEPICLTDNQERQKANIHHQQGLLR